MSGDKPKIRIIAGGQVKEIDWGKPMPMDGLGCSPEMMDKIMARRRAVLREEYGRVSHGKVEMHPMRRWARVRRWTKRLKGLLWG